MDTDQGRSGTKEEYLNNDELNIDFDRCPLERVGKPPPDREPPLLCVSSIPTVVPIARISATLISVCVN